MAFEEDVAAIKDYLRKILRTITLDTDFKIFKSSYVKRDKIDTLLCCILAKLPDSYKKLMKSSVKSYSSIVSFVLLQKVLTRKSLLNPNCYKINKERATQLINTVLTSIQRDIHTLESNI